MRTIETDEQHAEAVAELDRRWSTATDDDRDLLALAVEIERYEKRRFPIPEPSAQQLAAWRRENVKRGNSPDGTEKGEI